MTILRQALAGLALVVWAASGASAADLTPGGTQIMGCDVTLSGQIGPGDAARFAAYRQSDAARGHYADNWVLCLDSPGGSYAEGIAIARDVFGSEISTAIGPGQRCESACALIFMAGNIGAGDGYTETKRRLHPAGTLGFHAPGLTVRNGAYSEETVNQAYAVAVQSVRAFLELRDTTRLNFPESLLIEMLGTPPSDMRHVETIEDAALWKIDIFPIGIPDAPANRIVGNACQNLTSFVTGKRARDPAERPSAPLGEVRGRGTEAFVETLFGYLAEGTAPCQLTVAQREWVDQDSLGRIALVEGDGFGTGTALYRSLLFPPAQQITTLPAPRPDDLETLVGILTGTGGGRAAPACLLLADTAHVVNVTEFVNMRASPAFDSDILRQVPLDEKLTVLGAPVFTDLGGLKDTCTRLCQTASAPRSDVQTITRCQESHSIWYNLRDSTGQTGFVSRQFLQ